MPYKEKQIGILSAAGAYLLWGVLPIYWKSINMVPPVTVLAHRVVWSFVFMLILLLILNKWQSFIQECKAILSNKKKWIGLIFSSLVISVNWLLFIWAVNSDHVIQASLGYYINPLISILLGIVVLKERLNKWEIFSVGLAACGVLYLTFYYGVFPWVSILLAISFGIYGLLKKIVAISSLYGLTLETLIVFPIALIYLCVTPTDSSSFVTMWDSETTAIILVGSGLVTAVPLLLFAEGAKKISLSMIGFLQYIAPTLMLLLGVFVYDEVFTSAHTVAFLFIWIALAIYTSSRMIAFRNIRVFQ
ncbi:EamA family transporter RarD [Paraliobacillus ryukyuensis]|uniref:EamA family transporter RarD n=1 Tax=Paraliobacillus ryukyuensis TaxID=200904 RepID=UPI0009A8DD3D|nr:EamA family transporter RarD [Paraliobacillus ryukyuensis]